MKRCSELFGILHSHIGIHEYSRIHRKYREYRENKFKRENNYLHTYISMKELQHEDKGVNLET